MVYKSIVALYEPIIIFFVIVLIASFNVQIDQSSLTDIIVIIVLYNRIFAKLNILTSNLIKSIQSPVSKHIQFNK